jgi:hypothetical protein
MLWHPTLDKDLGLMKGVVNLLRQLLVLQLLLKL